MSTRYTTHNGCILLCLLLLGLTGCGGKKIYPVEGRLVDSAGQPILGLEKGSIEFESTSAKMSAQGVLDAEGRFKLTTETTNDGALLGTHRVLIMPAYLGPDTPLPRVLDKKYERYETSTLTATVEAKRKNEFVFIVEKIKK